MPRQSKLPPRQKRSVKRLLDDILPPKTKKTKVAATSREQVGDITPSGHSTNAVDSCSSSALKTYEEVKKCDQGTSPDPTLPQSEQPTSSMRRGQAGQVAAEKDRLPVTANSGFFYSPMYRRYFGLTPPNPRLCNPRLLEDYIDWYLNVYMEEELPWQWISVGNPQERAEKDEEEAKEEAKKSASPSTTSTKDNS